METKFFDYKTVKEAATEWGISERRVLMYCQAGRIPGLVNPGRIWFIPRDAVKPADGRVNNRRHPRKEKNL
ncbi:hypothetical protein FACS189490_10400 [Clostridia bacterium]|nr:hypothetical protein FACS189490_10400 [Clostridia bacterium]